MAGIEQIAPILGGVAAVIGAASAAAIGYRNSRGNKTDSSDESSADRAAVAVTNFERTAIKVDALWDTIHGLIEEVAQLKEDKVRQQEEIDQLKSQLDVEQRRHTKTKAKLARVEEQLLQTQKLLAEKEKEIIEILKREK